MNNDLISREALRNEVDSWGCNDFDKYDFLEAIDKAPTVEPIGQTINAYTTGFNTGVETVKRPQGEWIEFKGGYYKCNKCGKVERAKKNFCSHCGVQMKGNARDGL